MKKKSLFGKKRNAILLAVLLVFLFSVPITVAAQTTSTKERDSTTLGTITVTAQKKEENVQDVPISMTVLDSLEIEDRKIEKVTDIALSTPSLSFVNMNFGGWTFPVMRGLGSNWTLASSTTMFVDGIPVSNYMGFDEVLMDIERIEVLKGPQGTLYGKDTEAGAINIITRQPGNDVEGKVSMQLGSDDKREYAFSTGGPIIKDKLFIRLSGRHYEKDGQIPNTCLGGMIDDQSNNYGKLQLRATPSDDLDISLISSFLKYGNGGPGYNSASATKEIPSDIHGYDNSEIISHALKAKYRMGRYQIEGLVTQREYKGDGLTDLDFSSLNYCHNQFESSYKRRSGELRLSSVFGNLNWLIGIYGDNDKDFLKDNVTNIQPQYRDDKSIGLFAHGDYQVTGKLSFTGGIRYDYDDKTFQQGTNDLSNTYNAFSPKFAVNYNLTEKSMIYTTVSKGYKSGGFDLLAPEGQKEYDMETLISYEIGTKNTFLNNSLLVNLALYYMDISDMQVSSELGMDGNTYVTNAASATSQGLELEITYRISRSLEIFGGLGINQTEFDEYSDLTGNYRGNNNTYAPKYTGNIGAQYRSAKGLFARCDLSGYGKTYLDKANKYERDAYAVVNAKIGYEKDSFDIYLYADNLFDEEYDSRGEYMVFYSQPQEIGVQLTYRF